jgi:hypothetical protein
MIQSGELVNLLVSIILFIYTIILVKEQNKKTFHYWLMGIMFLMFSQISTVTEGFLWPVLFNISEHLFFTIACLLFLIGALKRESI